MLFTSYQFIIFLSLVFLVFYCVPGKFQTAVLLLAGYIFYLGAGEGCLIYILVTTVVTFFTAKKISCLRLERQSKRIQKRWLIACLCVDLGLLCVFKYTNFTIHNINGVLQFFHEPGRLSFINIVLPLGISFYTFQSVGYIVDVYRGKYEAEKNLLNFSLFVSFFPQLIQGPISRFDELRKTLFIEKRFDKMQVYSGMQRIVWGYFKKLVIADRILVAVNEIIHSPERYQGAYVFCGALFYAVELYADFTGGVDITIGIGELFGIRIAENFDRPFLSKSVKEYWTRWHISMGTWFRDYVFYPVSVCGPMKKMTTFLKKRGGRKVSKKLPVYLASFIVWFLTGLWHGASWNFIAWGLGNFFIIMISEECRPLFERFHKRFPKIKHTVVFSCFQIIRTILLMSCLRMFDCYRSVSETVRMFCSMFTKWNSTIIWDGSLLKLGLNGTDYVILALGTALMYFVSIRKQKGSVRGQIGALPAGLRFIIWYGLFLSVILFGAYGIGYDATQFIYSQF